MDQRTTPDAYGVMIEPATLKMQRILPGPAERIWAYLTDSDLRRQWLAEGPMGTSAGAAFELTWRNDELTDPPGARPAGFSKEHSMQGQIVEFEPPRKLVFTWQGTGDVSFELEPFGKEEVLLTVIHRRVASTTARKVGPGWHAHLDLLVARVTGRKPGPFWDDMSRLQKEYERRLPS